MTAPQAVSAAAAEQASRSSTCRGSASALAAKPCSASLLRCAGNSSASRLSSALYLLVAERACPVCTQGAADSAHPASAAAAVWQADGRRPRLHECRQDESCGASTRGNNHLLDRGLRPPSLSLPCRATTAKPCAGGTDAWRCGRRRGPALRHLGHGAAAAVASLWTAGGHVGHRRLHLRPPDAAVRRVQGEPAVPA